MVVEKYMALDSNIAIDLLNGKAEVIEQLAAVQRFYLPVTVCGELLFGAKNSARKVENETKLQHFIDRCQVMNVNLIIANEYATVRKQLKDIGNPIPENDIWIAAICKVNGLTLASRDYHFDKVEGLKLFKVG